MNHYILTMLVAIVIWAGIGLLLAAIFSSKFSKSGVALPTVVTSIAASLIMFELSNLRIHDLVPLVVAGSVLSLWVLLIALHAPRVSALGSRAYLKFVVAVTILASSLTGAVFVAMPAIEPRDTGYVVPGRVELLVNNVSDSATLQLGIARTDDAPKWSSGFSPVDEQLEVNGRLLIDLELQGKPGAVATYALLVGSDNSLFDSDQRFSQFDMPFQESFYRFGKVAPDGNCEEDPVPSGGEVPVLPANSATILSGTVTLGTDGAAKLQFRGSEVREYSTLIGDVAEVEYPNPVVRTSDTDCVITAQPLAGAWVGPKSATVRVTDAYAPLFGVQSSIDYFPRDAYNVYEAAWERTARAGDITARGGWWPNQLTLRASTTTVDRKSASLSSLRLFGGAGLLAIATTALMQLIFEYPQPSRAPAIPRAEIIVNSTYSEPKSPKRPIASRSANRLRRWRRR